MDPTDGYVIPVHVVAKAISNLESLAIAAKEGDRTAFRDGVATLADLAPYGVYSAWVKLAEAVGDKEREAVAALDALDGGDPEVCHGEADDVLLESVPTSIREAYQRVIGRCGWWATA